MPCAEVTGLAGARIQTQIRLATKPIYLLMAHVQQEGLCLTDPSIHLFSTC